MRPQIGILAFCAATLVAAQPGQPYCIWEDQGTGQYLFSRLDAATGILTTTTPIVGMNAFVAGNKTAFDTDAGYYHFTGLSNGAVIRFYTVDVASSTVIHMPPMPDNVVGIEYNPNDQLLYGLREVNNNYDLVTIDPVSGSTTSVGLIPSMNAYVVETFTLDPKRSYYTFVANNGSGPRLRTYDLADASLAFDVPFPDNLVGHHYHCPDSTIYALWEDGAQYKLERISLNGSHATVAVLSNVSPGFVSGSSSMETSGVYTYRGFDGANNFAIISINVVSGNVVFNTPTMDNAKGFEEANICPNLPTSVHGPVPPIHVELYPQPATDILNVRIGHEMIEALRIYSLQGELVLDRTRNVLASPLSIGLSSLKNGGYIMETRSTYGHMLRKPFFKVGPAHP